MGWNVKNFDFITFSSVLKVTVTFYQHFVLQIFLSTFLLDICSWYTLKENFILHMWASVLTVLSTLSFISSFQMNRHFVFGLHLVPRVFFAKICVIIPNEYIFFWWSSICDIPQKKILFLTCRLQLYCAFYPKFRFHHLKWINLTLCVSKILCTWRIFIPSAQTLFPPELSADLFI